MWRGISLANKCLLLFGAAVVLIIPRGTGGRGCRQRIIVEEGSGTSSRPSWVQGWIAAAGELAAPDRPGRPQRRRSDCRASRSRAGQPLRQGRPIVPGSPPVGDATLVVLTPEKVAAAGANDPFIGAAYARSSAPPAPPGRGARVAQTKAGVAAAPRLHAADGPAPLPDRPPLTMQAMIVLDRTAADVNQGLVNAAYMLSASLIALGLAVMVFYLITNRLIPNPRARTQDHRRARPRGRHFDPPEIQTGRRFEELGETFNQMLEAVTAGRTSCGRSTPRWT